MNANDGLKSEIGSRGTLQVGQLYDCSVEWHGLARLRPPTMDGSMGQSRRRTLWSPGVSVPDTPAEVVVVVGTGGRVI